MYCAQVRDAYGNTVPLPPFPRSFLVTNRMPLSPSLFLLAKVWLGETHDAISPAYALLSDAQTRCHIASLNTVAVVKETGILMMEEYPE